MTQNYNINEEKAATGVVFDLSAITSSNKHIVVRLVAKSAKYVYVRVISLPLATTLNSRILYNMIING